MKTPFIPLVLLLSTGAAAIAAATSPQAAVARQGTRWLDALIAGDRAAIDSLLAPNYQHITSDGQLLNRAQELATANEKAPPMKWTGQTYDVEGNVVIVRGLNTMTVSGKTVRVRFTDLYVNNDGKWLAISAQESPVTK
ncbi:MAG TPA: nuclear transport factor 2 family protein [Candidatus Baltobacteraceae bacterium]|nr:nuclear transport factor 2 family protein [Candidatus Baltobacteraceae bacterium]